MQDIQIGKRIISAKEKPFVIAEMSGNHQQSLEKALKIVEAAAAAGVDALKIQTYTAETMTINHQRNEFLITDENSLWHGYSLYDLYAKAYTPWEWHDTIFEHCRRHGIIGFSTPFDMTAVDFLESLEVPLYKIASFENVDLPLIQRVAQTGKPVIISSGLASIAELDDMVKTARYAGCRDLIILKCTSSYPASPANSNLQTIPHMRDLLKCQIGLSDHTLGIGVAVASVALGATVIEKHFVLDRAEGGVDSAFSLEPQEMRALVLEAQAAHQALGHISYGPSDSEINSLQFRRSLYVVHDVQAGEILTTQNVRAIRPGLGLSPKYYQTVLGQVAKRPIARGTPLSWALLK